LLEELYLPKKLKKRREEELEEGVCGIGIKW